jgi:hypothetical protein
MKLNKKWPKESDFEKYTLFLVLSVTMILNFHVTSVTSGEMSYPDIYVPYQDLPFLIEPADSAVLMDRDKFEELLAEAEAHLKSSDSLKLGQVEQAEYSGEISGEKFTITGKLQVASISDGPVMVPLKFARIGLTKVALDGMPAPLGYDKQGCLTLIVDNKGTHELDIEGSTILEEISGGGMQLSMSVPEAVAGKMKISAPGNLEIHATVPLSEAIYDKSADRTVAEMTLGGQSKLTAVLLGNGRQDDDRAILLGESVEIVNLAGTEQTLSCFYTVQVLRRGVRQLNFLLGSQWTITDVSCPRLVRWSVEQPEEERDSQILTVLLRSGKTGAVTLHIQAIAARKEQNWRSSPVVLVDAQSQRGYLSINLDEGLGVRGQMLNAARREDKSITDLVSGLNFEASESLYFHWGPDWSVNLELVKVESRKSIKEQQKIVVSSNQVTLTGDFEVTAVGRELFDMTFVLPGPAEQWQIQGVSVDGKATGFDYRVEEDFGSRSLKIELPRPVMPEKTANVSIVMQNVPSNWNWPSNANSREISVRFIDSRANTVSGYVSISAAGDLDASPVKVPAQLEMIPVGRMASLGIQRHVQYAYNYISPVRGDIRLQVSRRRDRQSSEAVGLIDMKPGEFVGNWRIIYNISRASTKRLYLLVDKSLGREFKISSSSVSISSKSIIETDTSPISIPEELLQQYDMWLLNLDSSILGQVSLDIHYESPVTGDDFQIPLVRPVCNGQINEHLAVQASEELAIEINADAAKEIDAIDLPILPVEASRIIAAYQLDTIMTPTGPDAAVLVHRSIHQNYEIPSALVISAELTTLLDIQLRQRTDARFRIANASLQFLTIRLPDGAQLWSLQVDNRQAKPQQSPTGDYQVPLRMQGKPVEVRLVYAYEPNDLRYDQVKLGAVDLPGLKINQLSWNVIPPPDYKVSSQKTSMHTGDLLRTKPAYLQVLNSLRYFGFPRVLSIRYSGGTSGQRTVSYAEPPESHTAAGYGGMGGAPPASRLAGTTTGGRRSDSIQAGTEGQFYYQRSESQQQAPVPTRQMDSQTTRAFTQGDRDLMLTGQGRLTLPVDLVSSPGAGPSARFSGMGEADLVISLTSQSRQRRSWIVGFLLIITLGLTLIRRSIKFKVIFLTLVLFITSLTATWYPDIVYLANGIFMGGIILVLLWFLIFIFRWFLKLLGWTVINHPDFVAATLVFMFYLGSPGQSASAEQLGETGTNASLPHIIIPYDRDIEDIEQTDKVLIPYARYVELWNQAHPEDPIEQPRPGTDISLADVQYKVNVENDQLNLILTAYVETYGKDWVVIPLPIMGLAVTEATLDGGAARLQTNLPSAIGQAGTKGMVLILPGEISGRLQLRAVAKPEYLGRRGSISFSLPPFPAAVMEVILPQNDLELEIENIEGAIDKREVNGMVRWTVGLGMTRQLSMRWLPKLGRGTGDRTLSANSEHDVYAFHWAVVGVSRITYSFSGGEHDRFTFVSPKGTVLTDLKGDNVRDYSRIGEKTIDGAVFDVIEVRLHRAARKQCELNIRWLDELPVQDKPSRLMLVRASDVSRESGTVTLHSVGGMEVKTTQVIGARRTNIADNSQVGNTELSSDRAIPVAKYYWPYRPFELFLQFSPTAVSPVVNFDQLVRIGSDRVDLFVGANLKAERGKLFGASFVLPQNYELLSVVGPAVEDFYERSNESSKFVHIEFNRGISETELALVLIKRDIQLGDFVVPFVMYSGEDKTIERKGRVAVQIAASLEGQTISSENLNSIIPGVLKDWLNETQINAVQFAYMYEGLRPSLRLELIRRPTQIRAEVFAGLVIKTTSAFYTYRLRYNISGSPVDRLSFTLPEEYASLMAVESPSMRNLVQSETSEGISRWTVSLLDEVTGLVDVTVNFSLPLDASTSMLPVPRLEADVTGDCRSIVAVQNMSRHDINVRNRENLSELALSEQQNLMPGGMMESLQYVYQSFEQNWSLELSVTAAKAATRIQAVVDLLALTTVIGRDGRCRYEARVELQNRSEQFLRIHLPQGLRLWSAKVAEQPVKPVQTTASPENEVLIPLVKTSPGGLPYDIYMYFADDGSGPLVEPLNGITRLEPPCISIIGMPVTRTTWSLLLPGGYRYIRPGGNMSAVAGTAEMLSLGIEAKLEQLGRLERSYREAALVKGRKGQIVKKNWTIFNQKLAREINQADSYLAANRNLLSDEQYQRLRSKLGGQRQMQNMVVRDNTDFIRQQQEQVRNDMNYYLNASASNYGISERIRNNAMLELPHFVAENERQQLVRLQQDLEISEQQREAFTKDQSELTPDIASQREEKTDSLNIAGKKADQLVFSDSLDKDSEVAGVLGELSRQNAAQIDRKQQQLKEQLEELRDNRFKRQFGGQAETQVIQTDGLSEPESQEQARNLRRPARPGGQAMTQSQTADDRTETNGSLRQGRRQVQETALPRDDSIAVPATMIPDEGFAPYVAKDVYSLPVTLPAGEIRLDFARSAGDAELSVLAVSAQTISNLYRTFFIIVVLCIVIGIIKLWPKTQSGKPLSALRIITYILLLVIMTVLLGAVGLLIGLLVILFRESKRGLFAGKKVSI